MKKKMKKKMKMVVNNLKVKNKSIIEELTFDMESTDDTEEEKSGGNFSKSKNQNKVHILKQKVY